MKIKAAVLAVVGTLLAAGNAGACETLQEAMAEFEGVKDAYVAAAPNMKPEQFQIWATHIQSFGDAMGRQDYATACATLQTAAVELGLADGGGGGAPSTTAGGGTTDGGGGPTAAAMEGTWTECPRGRCRN